LKRRKRDDPLELLVRLFLGSLLVGDICGSYMENYKHIHETYIKQIVFFVDFFIVNYQYRNFDFIEQYHDLRRRYGWEY
jgi:hypothetical protein